ncbi:MAG: PSD1 domain-containing protein [Planctomycetales bacterium]|nr:PSD1 domain-containing protein [Planctomycetales bacterium]
MSQIFRGRPACGPMTLGRFLLPRLLAVAFLVPGSTASGQDIDFAAEVWPLLSTHCLDCHGPEEQAGGLRIDRRGALLRGGDSGQPGIVPGTSGRSHLLQRIRSADASERMPQDAPALSAEQIDLLSRWVQSGAEWPGQMEATANTLSSDHWSLQALQTVDVPVEFTGEHPIDAFIARRLQAAGLSFSPAADAIGLLRRASFDLCGLPPTAEQLARHVSSDGRLDIDPLLDELLASPHYGERWAQHWLDIIRWAETVGFETNLERPHAWPYRDWVIQALNEDKPYDQFVFEQLAGDTLGQDAALGFLVAGPANLPGQVGRDEEAMRQARQDELDEVINTVSQALLGLTIGCARCHNHKFDPLLAQDYYAFQAIFAGLSYGDRRWRGETNDAWTREIPGVQRQIAALQEQLDHLQQKYGLRAPLQDMHSESFPAVRAAAIRMEIRATAAGHPASLYEIEAWTTAEEGRAVENVALARNGAVPSASSFALANQTRHFENLVDGSRDRRQAFPWQAAQSGEAWLQVDFAQPARIDRIVWDRGGDLPVDYVIQVLSVDPASNTAAGWQTVAHTRNRLPRLIDTRAADQIELDNCSPQETRELVAILAQLRQATEELERLSAGPQVYAASFDDTPPETWLLSRGDPMQPLRRVAPAIPLILGDLQLAPDEPEVHRRVRLAEHLIHPEQPLTARVMVNRVWQYHFGRGLVTTPSDFGRMGQPPTHPELLDWLARWFIDEGWSLKKLHRLIMTSRTYQQSSRPREAALAVDAQGQLWWRFPPRRLEGEAIRDSMLAACGQLNLQRGGPGFDFFDQRGGLSGYTPKETFAADGKRRMIYAHKIRMQSIDVFGAFDCPDSGQMRPTRTQSITPLQALGLLNSPFTVHQAQSLAERIAKEVSEEGYSAGSPEAIERQVECAFQRVLSRPPTAQESQKMQALVSAHGLAALGRVLFNTSEFVVLR